MERSRLHDASFLSNGSCPTVLAALLLGAVLIAACGDQAPETDHALVVFERSGGASHTRLTIERTGNAVLEVDNEVVGENTAKIGVSFRMLARLRHALRGFQREPVPEAGQGDGQDYALTYRRTTVEFSGAKVPHGLAEAVRLLNGLINRVGFAYRVGPARDPGAFGALLIQVSS